MANIENLEKLATQIRRDCLRMIHAVQSGHPGGALSATEFITALYFNSLNHSCKPFNMNGLNEDLFFLSNGHLSALWYSALARSGYFNISELATFRKINSRLQGHPTTSEHLEGIRISSGSLGQGLSVAIGAAQAKKLNDDKSLVYVLMGDGELQEGQIWEAAMYATANKIDNIIAAVDYNKQQIDGSTNEVLCLGNLKDKFASFGWEVIEVEQGNNMTQVVNSIDKSKLLSGNEKPVIILLHTKMGYGVDFMTDKNSWHGIPPNDQQLKDALAQLPETLNDY